MTDPEPTFYRATLDLEALGDLDNYNEHDAVFVITEDSIDPLSPEAVEAGWEIRAARASKAELAEWRQAYAELRHTTDRIRADLEAARAAWEAACGQAHAKLQDAWEEYRPVHEAIDRRRDEVEELRERDVQERARKAQAEAAAAQAAEDAELGARTWVVYEPEIDSWARKKHPEMYVPVVHVAGCSVTKGREDDPRDKEWNYVRAAGVEATITAGGPLAAQGSLTGERVPVKLCGRCKPEQTLRDAGLGHVFERWRDEVESIQPPMHPERHLKGKLGIQEWRTFSPRKSGYTLVQHETYRKEGSISEHEILLGWWDADREHLIADEDRLRWLERELPKNGFAVRRFNEPEKWGGRQNTQAVAVRRMTAGEIRRFKETTAAPAHIQELE